MSFNFVIHDDNLYFSKNPVTETDRKIGFSNRKTAVVSQEILVGDRTIYVNKNQLVF